MDTQLVEVTVNIPVPRATKSHSVSCEIKKNRLKVGLKGQDPIIDQDVFLLCTNAMEYKSADTVYFRQARAMLEIAKKDFKSLRQESDGEEETFSFTTTKVVKRGRPPSSCVKK